MMLDKTLSGELNELVDAARAASDRIGRSDVFVLPFPVKSWQNDFCRMYRRVKKPDIVPVGSFDEALAAWFGCSAPALLQAITDRLGDPQGVFRAEDEAALLDALSGSSGRSGAFYTTEDAFFAAFTTHVLAFLMGNFD